MPRQPERSVQCEDENCDTIRRSRRVPQCGTHLKCELQRVCDDKNHNCALECCRTDNPNQPISQPRCFAKNIQARPIVYDLLNDGRLLDAAAKYKFRARCMQVTNVTDSTEISRFTARGKPETSFFSPYRQRILSVVIRASSARAAHISRESHQEGIASAGLATELLIAFHISPHLHRSFLRAGGKGTESVRRAEVRPH